MSGLDKNRFRNKTVSVRMSPEERRRLKMKLKITGIPKGKFIIDSILQDNIFISVGKFESDRLAVEIKKLREEIKLQFEKNDSVEIREIMLDCKVMLEELDKLMGTVRYREEEEQLFTGSEGEEEIYYYSKKDMNTKK